MASALTSSERSSPAIERAGVGEQRLWIAVSLGVKPGAAQLDTREAQLVREVEAPVELVLDEPGGDHAELHASVSRAWASVRASPSPIRAASDGRARSV